MGIDATRSTGNTDKLSGYLEGHADGVKCGMENMKKKACEIYKKHLIKYTPGLKASPTMLDEAVNIFRKQLEE